MKKRLKSLVFGLVAASLLSGGTAWAQTRNLSRTNTPPQNLVLATIDLRKVFDNYYKKKQAEALLKDQETDLKKTDDDMLADYKKLKADYAALPSADEPAISPEERDRRKKTAADKATQIKNQEDTIRSYERQADATLSEKKQRMRNDILNQIKAVVNVKAKAAGFDLVLDTAAETANLTPVALYSSGQNDLTDSVLMQLNSTAPDDPNATGTDTSEKSGGNKKDAKK